MYEGLKFKHYLLYVSLFVLICVLLLMKTIECCELSNSLLLSCDGVSVIVLSEHMTVYTLWASKTWQSVFCVGSVNVHLPSL